MKELIADRLWMRDGDRRVAVSGDAFAESVREQLDHADREVAQRLEVLAQDIDASFRAMFARLQTMERLTAELVTRLEQLQQWQEAPRV